jgi:hypothetical protein
MKSLHILGVVITLLVVLLMTACQPDAEKSHAVIIPGSLTTSAVQAPDDIVYTPGGVAYRANVIQEGVENPWPPVEMAIGTMDYETDIIQVQYRADITSKAGETRNNIIYVSKTDELLQAEKLVLYANTCPAGVELSVGGGAGRPGLLTEVLFIKITPQVLPGDYMFRIIIEVDGNEYGSVLCRIHIIE